MCTGSPLSVKRRSFINTWVLLCGLKCWLIDLISQCDTEMLDEHGPQPATHILWFHTNVFTELFHGFWTDHLVGAGILQEPGQALLTGEGFLGADELRTTDLRSSETATKSSVLKSTRLDGHKVLLRQRMKDVTSDWSDDFQPNIQVEAECNSSSCMILIFSQQKLGRCPFHCELVQTGFISQCSQPAVLPTTTKNMWCHTYRQFLTIVAKPLELKMKSLQPPPQVEITKTVSLSYYYLQSPLLTAELEYWLNWHFDTSLLLRTETGQHSWLQHTCTHTRGKWEGEGFNVPTARWKTTLPVLFLFRATAGSTNDGPVLTSREPRTLTSFLLQVRANGSRSSTQTETHTAQKSDGYVRYTHTHLWEKISCGGISYNVNECVSVLPCNFTLVLMIICIRELSLLLHRHHWTFNGPH